MAHLRENTTIVTSLMTGMSYKLGEQLLKYMTDAGVDESELESTRGVCLNIFLHIQEKYKSVRVQICTGTYLYRIWSQINSHV